MSPTMPTLSPLLPSLHHHANQSPLTPLKPLVQAQAEEELSIDQNHRAHAVSAPLTVH